MYIIDYMKNIVCVNKDLLLIFFFFFFFIYFHRLGCDGGMAGDYVNNVVVGT